MVGVVARAIVDVRDAIGVVNAGVREDTMGTGEGCLS
jgi:hypothetical protein